MARVGGRSDQGWGPEWSRAGATSSWSDLKGSATGIAEISNIGTATLILYLFSIQVNLLQETAINKIFRKHI